MTTTLLRILLLLMWLLCGSAEAELVVIANHNSGIDKLSKDEVINLYMGRNRKLPNGLTVLPLDLNSAHEEKAAFYEQLVGKEIAEINSYWARLRFSGQGYPPRQLDSADEVLNIVSENKGAIGYIDRKKIDKRVKLIYIVNP
ncbi:type 2 periplasmic-binding domain-containing protein [Undibacterium griseum]|uniref:Phosphate ABC transporter substrate-binding protein n=1 Tax=Undibacterium griseum TaxID=2762295 RepID=A0ABR6YQM8_9BURK|nr:hypothetical protein [Undibacterium griseum]MBC3886196.1 hypothetical protein [Undibacterium griseum]